LQGIDKSLLTDMTKCTLIAIELGRASFWQKALSLFRVVQSLNVRLDVVALSALAGACSKQMSCWSLGLRTLTELQNVGLLPNAILFGTATHACAFRRSWRHSLNLLRHMQGLLTHPTCSTYTAALGACERREQWRIVLALMAGMVRASLQFDVFTFAVAIGVLARSRRWPEALVNCDAATRSPFRHGGATLSAGLDASGKGLQWHYALHLAATMRIGADVRPLQICNALVGLCIKSKEWQKALHWFEDMQEKGLSPDRVVFNAVLTAVWLRQERWRVDGRKGDADLTLMLLQRMRRRGLLPNEFSYDVALKSCCCARSPEAALGLMDKMSAERLAPHLGTCSSVVRGCQGTGFGPQAALWREALALMRFFCGHRFPVDADACQSAIGACQSVSQWHIALRLRGSAARPTPRA